jgi:hypothetical protein
VIVNDVPNKPMVPTAPASHTTNPLYPLRRHIGQPLGSLGGWQSTAPNNDARDAGR